MLLFKSCMPPQRRRASALSSTALIIKAFVDHMHDALASAAKAGLARLLQRSPSLVLHVMCWQLLRQHIDVQMAEEDRNLPHLRA